MISDRIWAAALLMVNRYKDDAMIEAAQRADQLPEDGDVVGAATWHRNRGCHNLIQIDSKSTKLLRASGVSNVCSTIGPIAMTRILIIEDEELVRLTVKQMLEAAGHEVSTAVDGEDGLRQFRQQPADIVLCDVFMPNKDGIATLKELHEVSADVPVIMMSGGVPAPMLGETGPVDYLRLARLLGAASTMTKPFQTSHLLAAMETYLSTVDAP